MSFHLGLFFSTWRMPFDISFSVGLLVMNLSENIFISGSFVKVIFMWYRILPFFFSWLTVGIMVICPFPPRFLKNFSLCLCFSYVIVMSIGTNSFLSLFCLGFLGLLEPVASCLSLILESSQPLFSYCFCPILFLLSGISISYVLCISVSQPLVFFQNFISLGFVWKILFWLVFLMCLSAFKFIHWVLSFSCIVFLVLSFHLVLFYSF